MQEERHVTIYARSASGQDEEEQPILQQPERREGARVVLPRRTTIASRSFRSEPAPEPAAEPAPPTRRATIASSRSFRGTGEERAHTARRGTISSLSARSLGIDPAIMLMWRGDFETAETGFHTDTIHHNPLQGFRWAQVAFLRYWVHGGEAHAKEATQRLDASILACQKREQECVSRLKEPMRRLARAMGRSFFRPTLDPNLLCTPTHLADQIEIDVHGEWLECSGLRALSHLMIGATRFCEGRVSDACDSFNRSWLITDRAGAAPHPTIPLVRGIFQLAFSVVSADMLRLCKIAGFSADFKSGLDSLQELTRVYAPHEEAHHYACIAAIYYRLVLATGDFRVDQGALLKQAYDQGEPFQDWVLFKLTRARVLQRLGHLDRAEEIYKWLLPHPGDAWVNRCLALVKFAQGEYADFESIAAKLAKTVTTAIMLAASAGMRGDKVYARRLEDVLGLPTKDDSEASWKGMVRTLQNRTHTRTLFYEYCYHAGIFRWFSTHIGGSLQDGNKAACVEWLEYSCDHLTEMQRQAADLITYNSTPASREEHETLTFLLAACHSNMGQVDQAVTGFRSLTEPPRAKPTWQRAYALYELASIAIRMGEVRKARLLLDQVVCIKGGVLEFGDALSLAAASAKRFLVPAALPAAPHLRDELGTWVVDDTGKAGNAPPKMDTYIVDQGSCFKVTRPVRKDDLVDWKWNITTGAIKFGVRFQEAGEEGTWSVVEEPKTAECGEQYTGSLAAGRAGIVELTWDNTADQLHKKVLHHLVTDTKGEEEKERERMKKKKDVKDRSENKIVSRATIDTTDYVI